MDGELTDVAGNTNNVRLFEATYVYDDMDRLEREELQFFKSDQSPIGDGVALTLTAYTDSSQVRLVTDDNGHATLTTYDTANRVFRVTDAKNSTVTYDYDPNSNVTTVTEVEESDLGNPDQEFRTSYGYDSLDRLGSVEDSAGNIVEYRYDSRDNRTRMIDALRSSPAGPGNVVNYAYDGFNRLVSTTRVLTDDGTGDGTPTGSIVTGQAWDDTSRPLTQTDDNGNVTTYVYDALDRREKEIHADSTEHTYTYDVHDNRTMLHDPNGTDVTYSYDQLGFPRFRGHYPRGGYDVDDGGGAESEAHATALLERVQGRCGSPGLG